MDRGTAGVAQCGSVLRGQTLHCRIVALAHVKVSDLNKQTQLWLCSNQPLPPKSPILQSLGFSGS